MIKKNQFALIFLTIVTMLAVWYVKAPISAKNENNEPASTTPTTNTGRLESLTAMREAIRNERSILTASYDAILADENATLKSSATGATSLDPTPAPAPSPAP